MANKLPEPTQSCSAEYSGVNLALQEIVNAVLYHAHDHPERVLTADDHYNRFTVGRIFPDLYHQRQDGRDLCQVQSEVLLETGNDLPELQITVGFVQPVQRQISVLHNPLPSLPVGESPAMSLVSNLEVNGHFYQTGLETVERQITIPMKTLHGSVEAVFNFEAQHQIEPIYNEQGLIAAVIRREQAAINGKVILKLHFLKNGLSKVSVQVLNETPVTEAELEPPDNILLRTLASAHVIFRAKRGHFVSLWEAPGELKYFADQCHNIGVWPVLVGGESADEHPAMLASPIILYDNPHISHNAVVDLLDEPEVDEILTMRALAMTNTKTRESDCIVYGSDVVKLPGNRPGYFSNELEVSS
jgi:hypothetical protein